MASEPEILRYGSCVNDKESGFFLGKKPLNSVRQLAFKLLVGPCAVKKENSTLLDLRRNIILFYKTLIVARNYIT